MLNYGACWTTLLAHIYVSYSLSLSRDIKRMPFNLLIWTHLQIPHNKGNCTLVPLKLSSNVKIFCVPENLNSLCSLCALYNLMKWNDLSFNLVLICMCLV